MSPWQTVRVALNALRRNKLRSFLTALGIVIGVAAVIAMVAIGEGAKAKVQESFEAMGTNLLIIMPGSTKQGGARGGFGSASSITWDDFEAIRTELPSVAAAAPNLRTGAQVQSEEQNWGTSVQGTTPNYFRIRTWGTALGVPMTDSDLDSGAKVVVRGGKNLEDAPPLSSRVPSGVYTVVVRLGNGSLSPQWRGSVKPDEARKLTYDVATQRWNDR